jgi:hypothetical protein
VQVIEAEQNRLFFLELSALLLKSRESLTLWYCQDDLEDWACQTDWKANVQLEAGWGGQLVTEMTAR